ncbi:MAG: ABC transporter substrate-binding protein [Butyribacter sp.]|jgi:raffinose/stachyose/melibiose transport system substrate-binding protein|uniref:ABC transporter substrate-binding protein n=1 Tax=Clostridia TaxID=186801 RepID=UPI00033E0C70|nr:MULTISPECIES: ABC transporter substrate-binding protein [Clostridia]RHP26071.1 ABC transporter substrate-binding protein [Clostridium sp. AF34-13]RHT92673.1 ABC transporter substrate-binding protein [Clostridium sp. AM27-31LB]UYJ41412.1 MAG: ABC transporter substrate-binding protein [Lachnospiraceae bacterium]CCZ40882.1 aBC transporter solute-binding protein [Clostridium sp. CAG:122]
MRKKGLVAFGLAAVMTASALTGCGGASDKKESGKKEAKGTVYYLNFKPEADAQWQELAKLYTDKTGVKVNVVTAAANQYETTLKSEMGKSEAPTLFQVNGPVGLASWKDYCYDLKDSDIAKQVTSDDFLLKDGDAVDGIGYAIESYGIIYNKNLLKKAGYTQDDIKSFDDLKKVAEDITKRSKDLGFSAFTSAGMDGSSDWRFKTHLANLPIYYEYQKDGIENTDAIKGTYLDNYRNIWNLYINNSTTSSKQLSTKTGDDAVAEFVTEKAVFYQNGTWAYSDIADLGDDNLGMLPIYIGADGEENQGLCTGTENYWCVNKKASKEDIQATLDFMNWCVTDDTAVKCMCGAAGAMPSGQDGMGFVIPFKKNLTSDNPLVNIANDYVKQGKKPVTWNFTTMPSEKWKNDLGSALTTYASKQTDANWDLVKKAFVDGWKKEAAAAKK